MADTFTTSLSIRQIETGTRSGTWGSETNTQYELLDNAFSYVNHDLSSDADATLTISDGTASDARYFYIKFTSSVSLTATRTITLAPDDSKKIWIVENATTGSQSLTFKQGSSGGTVTVANGNTAIIYADGAGATNGAITNAFTDLQLAGTASMVAATVSGDLTVDTSTLYVDSTNNRVGIGTTSPAKKLAVKSDGGGSQLGIDIHNEGIATGDDSVISFETQGSREFTIGLDRSATSFVIAEASDLNSNQRLVIDDSGNLGVGATSPSYKLEVAGDASFLSQDVLIDSQSGYKELRHTQTGENFAISSPESLYFIMDSNNDQTSRSIVFAHNNTAPASATELMRIGENGNVGIGTSSPASKLHIAASSYTAPTGGLDPNINLLINNTQYSGIQILGSSTGSSFIHFGDQNNADVGLITYEHNGDYMRFDVNATECMRLTSDGRLQLANLSATNTNLSVFAKGNYLYALGGTSGLILGDDSAQGTRILMSTGSNYMKFDTNGGERVRINSSGNVGIGTSSPDDLLHVFAGDSTATPNGISALNVENNGSVCISIMTPNTSVGQIRFADPQDDGAGILGYDHSVNAMVFSVNGPEKMRIDSSGNVLIGKTSTGFPASDGVELLSDGKIKAGLNSAASLLLNRGSTDGTIAAFFRSGTEVGQIVVTSSSTSYNTSSDYRLKENVVEMEGAIDRVKLLQPKRFNFIADETDTTVDGFLAHEVQDIVPEAIHGIKDEMQEEEYEVTPAVLDEDGNVVTEAVMGTREVPVYQGIDQSKLVPLLTKAIQEQQVLIEQLQAEVALLKGE